MADLHDSQFLDDPEFQSLLVGCLESLQRGETIDRAALTKDFPRFAEEIARFLNDRQLLEQVASDFGDVQPSPVAISAYAHTMDSNAAPNDLSAGETVRYIGEYEILDEIARGGMGVVFKACQQKLNRTVALKMILAGRLASTGDVERFYREARAAGRLNHPNIVPVHEVGEHDGRHYFTMDYVDGCSLADTIRDETLAPRDAAALVRTTAEAVHYAHEQGTVHRDLKPANVLLDADRQPKVTDFGLAKMLGSADDQTHSELTASGQILGTPSYMSPEQASGKQELVGPASDIYSLGAILYASLTGRAPFVADSPVDTLLQVINKEPVSPRDLNPSVPKDLETICLKCLTKEQHKRYGTAQQLADDLECFLEGRPIHARPVGRAARTWMWSKRNPAVAGLLGLVAITLLSGTAVSSYFAVEAENRADAERQAKERQVELRTEAEQRKTQALIAVTDASKAQAEMLREMQRADEKAETANEERKIADTKLSEAEWLAHGMKISSALGYWNAGESRLAWLNLRSTKPRHRGWEFRHLKHQFTDQFETLLSDTTLFKLITFDHSGNRLATVDQAGLSTDDDEICVWDANCDQRLLRAKAQNINVECVALSADGTRVAVGGRFWRDGQHNFCVWDVRTGKLEFTGKSEVDPVRQIAFRSGGTELVTFAGNNQRRALTVWNIPAGQQVSSLVEDRLGDVLMVLSKSGTAYGLKRQMDVMTVSNLLDGQILGTWQCWDRDIESFAISQDESTLALVHRDQLASVIALKSSSEAPLSESSQFALHMNCDFRCAISSDNRYLVTYPSFPRNNDEWEPGVIVKVWDVQTGRMVAQHQGHRDHVVSLAVHPKESTFVTGSNDRTLLRWPTIPDRITPLQAVDSIRTIRFSPDGKLLAVSGKDLQLWDVENRQVLIHLKNHYAERDVAFSHNGSLFALTAVNRVYVHQTVDGQLLWQTPKFRGTSKCVQFGPLGNRLYCGTSVGEVLVYDTVSRELLARMKDPRDRSVSPTGIISISIDLDRQLVLTAMKSGELLVWDLESKALKERHRKPNRLMKFGRTAIDASGDLLATAYFGGTPKNGRIWNLNDWSMRCELQGHSATTRDIAFHPSGTRVATASNDRTVKIWDTETGQELLTLSGNSSMGALTFSPDGRLLVAGGMFGELLIWDSIDREIEEREEPQPDKADDAIRAPVPRVFSIDLRSHLDGQLREVRFENQTLEANLENASIADELGTRLHSAIEELQEERPVGLRIWADPYLKYGTLEAVIATCHPYVNCQTPVIKAGPTPERAPLQSTHSASDSLVVTIGGRVDDQFDILIREQYFQEGFPFRQPGQVNVFMTPSGKTRVVADGKDLGMYPEAAVALNQIVEGYVHRWHETLAMKSQRRRNGTRLYMDPNVPVEAALTIYRSARVYWNASQNSWVRTGDDIVLPMFEVGDWPPAHSHSPSTSGTQESLRQ